MEITKLQCGFSTGASAAGAALAAALLLFKDQRQDTVTVLNPQGVSIKIPVESAVRTKNGARAVVIKDGGDDPDVTHGLEIVADLTLAGSGLRIQGGEGVGMVTLPGLPVPAGFPAINPVPEWMIREAVKPFIPPDTGITITICVPLGQEVAKQTMNQRLGIIGGISILGTTGIVRPMSVEALKDSLVPFIKKAVALGHKRIVLTPGGSGYRQTVEEYDFHPDSVIEMSNYVGFMLEKCVEYQIDSVLLWGQIGKLTKVAGGIFNTHSRVADGRREIVAANAALHGAKKELIAQILNSNTLESAVSMLEESKLELVFEQMAWAASQRATEYIWGKLQVGTVITDRHGRILGMDTTAEELGRLMGCKKLR